MRAIVAVLFVCLLLAALVPEQADGFKKLKKKLKHKLFPQYYQPARPCCQPVYRPPPPPPPKPVCCQPR